MTTVASYNSGLGHYKKYCERCGEVMVSIEGLETIPTDFCGDYCIDCQINSLENSKEEIQKHAIYLEKLLKCVIHNINVLKQENKDD